MDEYIKRKDAFEILQSRLDGISQMSYLNMDWHELDIMRDAIKKAIDDIGKAPVADVQPVKHGRWVETHISLCKWIPEDEKEEGHSFSMAELKCSCCERYNAVTFILTLNKPDFCQLCGARMDGDVE